MSCLSWEVFKHGVLCWAGADQGDLRESFLSQGLCRYPAVSFSWGRQGPAGHEHCSLALHGLTPARLRCVDGAGGNMAFLPRCPLSCLRPSYQAPRTLMKKFVLQRLHFPFSFLHFLVALGHAHSF